MTVDVARQQMKSYWEGHSSTATVETMMLDSHAKALTELELPEILGRAPYMEDKDVLELAAGIGRYTSVIAKRAKSVTAVEFIEDFIKVNADNNGHLGNVKFLCKDVVNLEAEPNSFDVIFSNWIFMYMEDEEVKEFAKKAIRWLRPGGKLFFRESCFKQSGDFKRGANPTRYRHPAFYIGAFSSVISKEDNGDLGYFNLESSGSVAVYRKIKKNNGQVFFSYSKAINQGASANNNDDDEAVATFQKFLDEQQYSNQSITRYERIFGQGYVSTGGQATTTEFVEKLNLKPGERVLDVGCGIGGGDFYMARQYGVSVVGIDLSTNMVHRALETSMQDPNADVEFEICDATQKEFPDSSFDVVYSRDTILHIEDKQALFAKFFRWLKPGGRVLISDYCRGEQESSDRFKNYVAGRGYHLLSPSQYGKVLESVGFTSVVAEDRTNQFVEVLKEELARTLAHKDEFVSETSETDFKYIVEGWEAKIVRCGDGDQKWGLFYGKKA
ncbi:Phosphoethanolamine [Phytophthora fragariae]|uniref:phosphoethanolamine N-methyltransferase n=1 Tax=Phytophthora fragariae TaxID=53985 RepID=A0A6A3DSY2_9STRA|nr:Phosphoethanolamine [Phytophthora fragariae]KAE8925034.1 Phosphoethanolamine [Phytophthora fragariae]KAE8979688.1 Phosphoethanolamine [Phytophthora fragariae]KAE9098981.1 Phosphoethanolamine [Phytophthora fragariae]KAE9179093.1 Phosphoethanolamine [Phytophthora fragariae]